MAEKSKDWGKLVKKAAEKGVKAAAKAVDNIDLKEAGEAAKNGVNAAAKAVEGIDFNKVAKAAKDGVNAAAKFVEDVDLNEGIEKAAKAAKNGVNAAAKAVENIDLNDVAKVAKKGADVAANAVNNVVQDIKEIDFKGIGDNLSEKAKALLKEKEQEKKANQKLVSGRGAAKILYYVMAADGEVYNDEEEKYNEICRALYKNFDKDKERIKKECTTQIEKTIETEDYYDVLIDGMADAIRESQDSVEVGISPKLLIWDLMVVAYSDNHYSESERRLMKYASRKLDINGTVFLEMENSMLTLMALAEEEAWIRTTDRPYTQVEKELKEIEERKATVMESVHNLIEM